VKLTEEQIQKLARAFAKQVTSIVKDKQRIRAKCLDIIRNELAGRNLFWIHDINMTYEIKWSIPASKKYINKL
jgi:hypothetical protein